MNIRHAHQAGAVKINTDIIRKEEGNKDANSCLPNSGNDLGSLMHLLFVTRKHTSHVL